MKKNKLSALIVSVCMVSALPQVPAAHAEEASVRTGNAALTNLVSNGDFESGMPEDFIASLAGNISRELMADGTYTGVFTCDGTNVGVAGILTGAGIEVADNTRAAYSYKLATDGSGNIVDWRNSQKALTSGTYPNFKTVSGILSRQTESGDNYIEVSAAGWNGKHILHQIGMKGNVGDYPQNNSKFYVDDIEVYDITNLLEECALIYVPEGIIFDKTSATLINENGEQNWYAKKGGQVCFTVKAPENTEITNVYADGVLLAPDADGIYSFTVPEDAYETEITYDTVSGSSLVNLVKNGDFENGFPEDLTVVYGGTLSTATLDDGNKVGLLTCDGTQMGILQILTGENITVTDATKAWISYRVAQDETGWVSDWRNGGGSIGAGIFPNFTTYTNDIIRQTEEGSNYIVVSKEGWNGKHFLHQLAKRGGVGNPVVGAKIWIDDIKVYDLTNAHKIAADDFVKLTDASYAEAKGEKMTNTGDTVRFTVDDSDSIYTATKLYMNGTEITPDENGIYSFVMPDGDANITADKTATKIKPVVIDPIESAETLKLVNPFAEREDVKNNNILTVETKDGRTYADLDCLGWLDADANNQWTNSIMLANYPVIKDHKYFIKMDAKMTVSEGVNGGSLYLNVPMNIKENGEITGKTISYIQGGWLSPHHAFTAVADQANWQMMMLGENKAYSGAAAKYQIDNFAIYDITAAKTVNYSTLYCTVVPSADNDAIIDGDTIYAVPGTEITFTLNAVKTGDSVYMNLPQGVTDNGDGTYTYIVGDSDADLAFNIEENVSFDYGEDGLFAKFRNAGKRTVYAAGYEGNKLASLNITAADTAEAEKIVPINADSNSKIFVWNGMTPEADVYKNVDGAKVFLAGDSTCCNYTEGSDVKHGWGEYFGNYLNGRAEVINCAIGGATVENFIANGYSDRIYENAKPGDFVIISLGINDAGRLNGDSETYKEQLKELCRAYADKGLTVLICKEQSTAFADAAEETANELGLTCIPLNSTVIPEYAFTFDGLHINNYGANLLAQNCAYMIKNSDSALKYYIK